MQFAQVRLVSLVSVRNYSAFQHYYRGCLYILIVPLAIEFGLGALQIPLNFKHGFSLPFL